MNQIDPNFLERSRAAFLANAPLSLADIRKRATAQPPGTTRRDMLSALDAVERLFGRPLAAIRADRKSLRSLLSSTTGPVHGLTPKRYANVCSLVTTAVRTYGESVPSITKRIPLSSAWAALLDRISMRTRRMALYRLACFCSAMNITPEQVGPDALTGFYTALDAEEVVKHPRKVLKYTVANWNMCYRTVPGWPNFPVSSPLAPKAYTFLLSDFPASFQADVAAWAQRMREPDFLDPAAPAKPLKPGTIDGLIFGVRRFASALVHRKVLALDQVTELSVFFELDRFKEGLRFFLHRSNNKPTIGLAAFAADLRNIAKHYCKVSPETSAELNKVCIRLGNTRATEMTPRNRERLRQFDDPGKIKRLLDFPANERLFALKQRSCIRAAKAMERALAVELLIHCCLRMGNLRTIQYPADLNHSGERCFLSVASERVKNGQSLEFELPPELIAALSVFVRDYRPLLPGADGPYLFPGEDGGARSHGAMALGIKHALKKRAGLVMNPHLFRHAIAKIVVERNPDAYVAVSQLLGHKRLDTTMASYLGTETLAAGRHINRLLKEAHQQPALPKD